MKKSKFLSVLISIILCLACLSSCGGNSPSEEADAPVDTEAVDMVDYSQKTVNVYSEDGNYIFSTNILYCNSIF